MKCAREIVAETDAPAGVAEIEAAGQMPFNFEVLPIPGELPPAKAQFSHLEEREPFGRWLLAQKDRGDWIDGIAAAARCDPAFPKNGSPEEVRKRMAEMGADNDVFEALDDAELDWASL